MKVEAVIAVIGAVGTLFCSKGFKKAMFGSYSDGTPRSFTDALNGEIRSPACRDRKYGKKKKKNKNKHR